MSNLNDLIISFIESYKKVFPDEKKFNLKMCKEISELKNMSKYIRGGLSKLTKDGIIKLVKSLKEYKQDQFIVNGKLITPDSEQKEIVYAPYDKNIRVVAGAGTGKTTTIACRIKHLLDNVTTPDKILVMTFNVEARKNLEKMIDIIMGFDAKIDIRTIDSFCYKLKQDFIDNNIYGVNGNNDFNSLNELGVTGRKIMEKYSDLIAPRYTHIFFDEFQDVNNDQFIILKKFADHGCSLTVIGDDSQNIYQFRGSDNYYIINFDKIIPNTLTYKITTNYRSIKPIIDLANDSICYNQEKIFKLMKPKPNPDIEIKTFDNNKIDLVIHDNDDDDVKYIINSINNYVDNYDIPYDQIAVLARNGYKLKVIETELERLKLPYVALISDDLSKDFKQIIQDEKIVLTTIHKAKGLEWSVVFIVGLADAYFPNHLNNGLKNIEEERRLFYVSVTRAKRFLHFIGNRTEIPFSRFLDEIKTHIQIVPKSKHKINIDDLFKSNDLDKKKDSYSVTKVIEMLSGKRIEDMRTKNLIPTIELKTNNLYTDQITFTDNIKKNVFESDYGIYCDYYMTRSLMINNEQPIRDIFTESILLNIQLNENERKLYDKYDLKLYFITNIMPKIIDQKDKHDVEKLINKIKTNLSNKKPKMLEQLISLGVKSFYYPREFMNILESSYNNYCNKSKNNRDILESIYYVSLCPKFHNDRRRLVYRNIHDLFLDNSVKVFDRVDDYVNKIKQSKILCKVPVYTNYTINDHIVSLNGEIDYINITDNTIVDIKCSEGDFKLEWMIQLLMYYSLFMINSSCCNNLSNDPTIYEKIHIKKLGIFNIFTGKYYEFDISDNYDWTGMLEYIEYLLTNDLNGVREKTQLRDIININTDTDNSHNNHHYSRHERVDIDSLLRKVVNNLNDSKQNKMNDVKETIVKLEEIKHRDGFMVLDVENNIMTNDIIQLSYIVYDEQDKKKEIKRVDYYVKDRFVDGRTKELTKITNDILKTKGISFDIIMKEFITDLFKVKIICGHHVNTDISKIKDNLKKYKIKIIDSNNTPIDNPFINIEVDDTSSLYRQIENKAMTLSKMYYALFNKTFENAHNAMVDVEHTAECYVELLNRGCKIKLLESKKSLPKTPKIKSTNIIDDNSDSESKNKDNDKIIITNNQPKPKRLFGKNFGKNKTDPKIDSFDQKIIIKPQNKIKTKPTEPNDNDGRSKKPNKTNLKSSTDINININNSSNKIELFDLINNDFFK